MGLRDVSVIIASYNQLRTLKLSIESFLLQSVKPCEIIVADDGSTDGTIEWLDSLDCSLPVSYITDEHGGYNLAGRNNRAVKVSCGERVLFTNGDIIHSRNSVKAHAKGATKTVLGGLIAGVRHPHSNKVTIDEVRKIGQLDKLSKEFPAKCSNFEYMIRDPLYNFYGVWGGNYSMSRHLFTLVGGFGSEFKMNYGGEEADFIKRAFDKGGRCNWAHESRAYHLEHRPRTYGKKARGNKIYRAKYKI